MVRIKNLRTNSTRGCDQATTEGTMFRLLPGISDIVPLRRIGEKADSQEWLSYPPRNDFIHGLLTVSEERFSARRG